MNAGESIAIIGGGIIGCAAAHRLRHRFRHIAIYESATRLGAGASGAAIGGIMPQSDQYSRGDLRLFADHSRRLYIGWLREIAEESGIEVPYLDTGLLQVAVDANEATVLMEQLVPDWKRQGFEVKVIDPRELETMEPLLTRELNAACLLPIEGAVEPRKLMSALEAVLRVDNRVRILLTTPVTALEIMDDGVAVSGPGYKTVYDRCILAAGHKSPDLLPALDSHMVPVRGQALEVRTHAATYPLRHHIYGHVPAGHGEEYDSAYLVPRSDGRVTIGVTYEPDETEVCVTAGGLRQVLNAAARLVPSVDAWEVLELWSGVRPGTVGGWPFIGFADPGGRIVVATGHFGIGVTLAPGTAEMLEDLLVTGSSPMSAAVDAPPSFGLPSYGA